MFPGAGAEEPEGEKKKQKTLMSGHCHDPCLKRAKDPSIRTYSGLVRPVPAETVPTSLPLASHRQLRRHLGRPCLWWQMPAGARVPPCGSLVGAH